MDDSINHKAMFEGFQNTPLLWETDSVEGLKQFPVKNTSETYIPKSTSKPLRLGKWIEAYTSFQLQKQHNIEVLVENLQIRREKQTIGELDLLLLKNNLPIHLEIAYKFYLYDTTKTYTDDLEHWIGPNRNDSFVYKINKLREKQLPLLYQNETIKVLETKSLNPYDFEQYVSFKAQLFLPYLQTDINMPTLNKKCIQGWYISFDSINQLRTYKFYIVNKLDWLCKPNFEVNWLVYEEAYIAIKSYIGDKQSPLCWIKNQNNDLQKCFITWW